MQQVHQSVLWLYCFNNWAKHHPEELCSLEDSVSLYGLDNLEAKRVYRLVDMMYESKLNEVLP